MLSCLRLIVSWLPFVSLCLALFSLSMSTRCLIESLACSLTYARNRPPSAHQPACMPAFHRLQLPTETRARSRTLLLTLILSLSLWPSLSLSLSLSNCAFLQSHNPSLLCALTPRSPHTRTRPSSSYRRDADSQSCCRALELSKSRTPLFNSLLSVASPCLFITLSVSLCFGMTSWLILLQGGPAIFRRYRPERVGVDHRDLPADGLLGRTSRHRA